MRMLDNILQQARRDPTLQSLSQGAVERELREGLISLTSAKSSPSSVTGYGCPSPSHTLTVDIVILLISLCLSLGNNILDQRNAQAN